jgi:tetratricopeptide (TPR) repeat protein
MTALNRPRTFVVAFLGLILFATAAMAAINIVIDPFWRFDLVTLPALNEQRPAFSSYARSGKAGVVCRLRPAQVAMGTSRVEVGLDPKHAGWASEPGPVYNLGLAGMGLKELSLTFQHAVNTSPLKRAVIGLDFLMFNANREASVFGTEVLDFDQNQLVLGRSDSCWRPTLLNADRLFGVSGLDYSFLTISRQLTSADKVDPDKGLSWLALYDRDGYRSYFAIGFNLILSSIGTRAAFSQEKYYVGKVWRPPPDERYCSTRTGQPNTMDTFRDMVRLARQSGVDVRFFLEPQHARLMLALQDAGLWPQFEDWKRDVVKVLADEAKESGEPQFPLWDFSGFNSITVEHLPNAEDKTTRLHWFWEGSHYRKEAGDLILDRVLDYHAPDRVDPPDFGVKLSLENIESWLVATRAAGRDYVRAEPMEARAVHEVVDRTLEDSSGSNCGYYIDELRTASAAMRRGEQETSEAAFARAKAIDDADRRRAAEMGVAYREPGFATTLRIAEAGGELLPNLANWQAYQDRGNQREAAGDHVGAADDFAHAIRIGPPNTALRYLRGVALLHAGETHQAATEFEVGLKLDPYNAALRTLLDQSRWQEHQQSGIARDAAGDHLGAAEEFANAIRLAPPNSALHYLRGVALLHAAYPQQAATEFEAGLKLEPHNAALKSLLDQAHQAAHATIAVPTQSVGESAPSKTSR